MWRRISRTLDQIWTIVSTVIYLVLHPREAAGIYHFYKFYWRPSCVIDMETSKFVAVNDSFCGKIGWTRSELIGTQFWDIMHEDSRIPTKEHVEANGYQEGIIFGEYINKYYTNGGEVQSIAWIGGIFHGGWTVSEIRIDE